MELIEIIISPGHDYSTQGGQGRLPHGTQHPVEVQCVAGKGLVGDRYYHGKADRKGQVTFLDATVVEAIRTQFNLPQLPAAVFRRNLIVSGADLESLLGQRFTLQGVEFEGSQECKPCEWMDRMVAPGVRKFMKTDFRGGLRAKVVSGGALVIASKDVTD